MRQYSAIFALFLAFSSHAVEGQDPVVEAIKRAEYHGSNNDFDKAVQLLAPFESLQRADVDYALAEALYGKAVNGATLEAAATADITRARALAERAAAKGDGAALNLLFLMHENGFGVRADGDRALEYLQRAVAAGDPGAKLNLAIRLYRGGTALGQDRDRACGLFTELQARPDPDPYSGYYLGLAHFRGQCGFAEDPAKGMALIEAAARRDVREAQSDMGKNFEFGWTGDKDIKQSLAWYQLAADKGEPYAEWRIGMAYVEGDQRAKDAAQAVAWFQRSAAKEHGLGLASLAVMVATGDGIAQDFAEAKSLYQRAAAAGNPHGYRGLAVMALRGEGGAPNPESALALYRQAVEAGNPEEPALLNDIQRQIALRQQGDALHLDKGQGGKGDSLKKGVE